MPTRILSGIRPTGHIHLGNYLGAIRSWVSMIDQVDERLFCIVDQHALTTAEDAKDLRKNTLTIAAAYIASGIDPVKNHIFVQSHVPYHTELAWYFNCITPMGWLSRMTQFKDKAGKNKDQAMTGLFVYPALMAADILIYKATHVPVGEDQKQHVELTRDIAQAFNNYVNTNIFPLPEPIIKSETARIMSLRDGSKKMSKSDPESAIFMEDSEQEVNTTIKKAFCPPEEVDGNPCLSYIHHIVLPWCKVFKVHRPESHGGDKEYTEFESLAVDYKSGALHPGDLKPALAKHLNEILKPVRDHFENNAEAKALLKQVKSYKVTK